MGWLSGWDHRRLHLITGSVGAGTNYIKRVYVLKGSGTSSGDFVYCDDYCENNFYDIRFTTIDGSTLLSFWREFYISGLVGVFWVQITADLDADQLIYIYFGNPLATDQSTTAHFLLFDHFETWDSGKWFDKYAETGSRIVEDSLLKLNVPSGINKYRTVQSIETFGVNTCVRFRMDYYLWRTDRQFELGFLDDPKTDADKDGVIFDARNAYRRWYNWENGDYNLRSYLENDVPVSGDDLDIRRTSARNRFWTHSYWLSYPSWDDDIYDGQILNYCTEVEVPVTFSLKAITGTLNAILHIDWVFVRKYVYPEPVNSTWGEIEPFLGGVDGTLPIIQFFRSS